MRRTPLALSIIAVGTLLIGGFFWISNAFQGAALAPWPASKVAPDLSRAVQSIHDQALAAEPNAAQSSDPTRHSVASSAWQPLTNLQKNASHDLDENHASAAHPPLSKVALDRLMDRHDCNNTPRTPARLASDLAYFDFSSEKWSDAMLAAYKFDLAYAPYRTAANTDADANKNLAISALMQRCINFDKLQAANAEGAPDIAKLEWSEYPEWATKVDVYEPKQVEKLIAAGQFKFLIQRARQNFNSFTAVPGARGNLAYRDFRALQLLSVPLSKGDQAGLQLLQHLLRAEIISRAEQEAIQLAQQVHAARSDKR